MEDANERTILNEASLENATTNTDETSNLENVASMMKMLAPCFVQIKEGIECLMHGVKQQTFCDTKDAVIQQNLRSLSVKVETIEDKVVDELRGKWQPQLIVLSNMFIKKVDDETINDFVTDIDIKALGTVGREITELCRDVITLCSSCKGNVNCVSSELRKCLDDVSMEVIYTVSIAVLMTSAFFVSAGTTFTMAFVGSRAIDWLKDGDEVRKRLVRWQDTKDQKTLLSQLKSFHSVFQVLEQATLKIKRHAQDVQSNASALHIYLERRDVLEVHRVLDAIKALCNSIDILYKSVKGTPHSSEDSTTRNFLQLHLEENNFKKRPDNVAESQNCSTRSSLKINTH